MVGFAKIICSSYLIFVDRPILIEWYQLRVFLPGLNKNPPPYFTIDIYTTMFDYTIDIISAVIEH